MAIDQNALSASRKKIQEAIDKQHEERRRALQKARITIARTGLEAFDDRKLGKAIQQFNLYLSVLEDIKGIGEGQLRPSHFDLVKDAPELLLISGVYWDLAKVYDRLKDPAKEKEFKKHLEKFVLFSKGMTFQPICTETLRRYVGTNNVRHRAEFKNALKQLSDSRCFIATELFNETEIETQFVLREFRDQTLAATSMGRLAIALYYRLSPHIVRGMRICPAFGRRFFGAALDMLARRLRVRP